MKQWIRLFQLNDRAWLERNLNEFIRDYDVTEIKVWNDQNLWCALVRYSYNVSPTYAKPDSLEVSRDV